MRSRYSAYVMNDIDYLAQTWHSEHRPPDLALDSGISWVGLQIIDFRQQGDCATVEFEARLVATGRLDAVHEVSCFVKEGGRWFYTSGDQLAPTFKPRSLSRNEACPCGSGRKFKRCCLR